MAQNAYDAKQAKKAVNGRETLHDKIIQARAFTVKQEAALSKGVAGEQSRLLWRHGCFILATGGELAFGRRKVHEEPVPEPPAAPPATEIHRTIVVGGFFIAGVLLAICRFCARQRTSLRRPYRIPDFEAGAKKALAADAEAEFRRVVKFLQDEVLIPIDVRLPGRPFEYDMHAFPFTPMVLVIGNHSSGKSTFINKLLGKEVQDTGVAPTDDGFTILERRTVTETEDGPTVLGCPENRPYAELQRFGQTLAGVLRRRCAVIENCVCLFSLSVINK
ncbi:Ehd2 [Symbiodinium necroappetens]|uniref:Ehd2 protein n=1 Tax=Symbiodinium necroappetens TaxID=1628268 RepID=A0A812Q324_9DINO|nr:Ehd2 [Symbiodinium necroappetens]